MCLAATICRLCLSNERRAYSLSNNELKNIWERLTNATFHNNEGRSLVICYICCAQLKRCHDLMLRAQEAEKVFNKLITNNSFDESNELVSLLVGKACELDYNYAVELQYNVEFTQGGTNTPEDGKDDCNIDIKKELEDVFVDEIIADDTDIDIIEHDVKGDQEDLLQFCHLERETMVLGNTDKELQDQSISKYLSLEKILQKEVRVVLQRFDQGAPNKTYKCKAIPQEAKIIKVATANDRPLRSSARKKLSKNMFNSSDIIWWSKNLSGNGIVEIEIKEESSTVNNLPDGDVRDKNMILQKDNTCNLKVLSYFNTENGSSKSSMPNGLGTAAPSTALGRNNKSKQSNICIKNESENVASRIKKRVRRVVLESHLREHTYDHFYFCDLCDNSYVNKKSLDLHILYEHTTERKYSCYMCEYKSVTKCQLKRHLRIHSGERPFACNFCDYKANRKDILLKHTRAKHMEERNFSCHLCKHRFFTKFLLDTHLKNYASDKPYLCHLCHYGCVEECTLQRHIQRKHKKERNTSCHICRYKFVSRSELYNHLRKHTGEKLFVSESVNLPEKVT